MSDRPSIVIDTNVWVSFFLWPNPMLESVLARAITEFQIIGARETLTEVATALAKPKFAAKMSIKERQLSFDMVLKNTVMIDIVETVTECRDPRDNKFLELAISGKAKLIITGDNDLLALHPWQGISILTPWQFIAYAT
jgi:putative PIN family toxin of toxin-antitoxin system